MTKEIEYLFIKQNLNPMRNTSFNQEFYLLRLKKLISRGFNYFFIFVLAIFINNKVNGQVDIPHYFPDHPINMFYSEDKTENAKAYNKLNTRAQRDSIIAFRLQEDWTDQIPASFSPYSFVCWNYALMLCVNSHDWGKNTAYGDSPQMYSGYSGNNIDSIHKYDGTLKDMGILGLPMYDVTLYDSSWMPEGHAINAVLTGDDATKFEDWTFIEPQNDQINVKPGSYSLFPKNCKVFDILYQFTYWSPPYEKKYGACKVIGFEIVDGEAKLVYNINDNKAIIPWRAHIPSNELVKLITLRQPIKSTPPPPQFISPIHGSEVSEKVKFAWTKSENVQKYELHLAIWDIFSWDPVKYYIQNTDTVIQIHPNYPWNAFVRGITAKGDTGIWSKPIMFRTTITGVEDISETMVKVYPNPATQFLQFDVPWNSNYMIEVSSLSGVLLKRFNTSGNLKLDISEFTSGFYFIRVLNGLQEEKFKFIKQ